MKDQQQAPTNQITIFYSYAHADERLLQQLETHLGLLRQQGIIATWHDRQIVAGTDWAQEIDTHLSTARVILLLISPDFLASDYCYGVELRKALERDAAGEARVIPILLRPVADWDTAPFARLAVLPTNRKPITTWRHRDKAWADVAGEIRRAIEHLQATTGSFPPSSTHSTVGKPSDNTVDALSSRQGVRSLFKPQMPSPLAPSAEQQNRRVLIHRLDKEYRRQLAQSLQGAAMMALEVQERTDVVLSSVSLVSWRMDASDESSLSVPTSIRQAYDDAGSGLLILGAPGAGKSTLLRELAGELINRAEQDVAQPIPVIVNLSSWAIKKPPLKTWLVDQLQLVYAIPRHLSQAWVEQDQLLLLLDGLDEVEASARTSCIEAINVYRAEHFIPLVVCSRSQEYLLQGGRLRLPVAAEVRPLTPEQVDTYLKGVGNSMAAVRAALKSNAVLRALVTTPLMLSVVMLAYRGKTVKDLPQLGAAEEQQRQVFEHYVTRMMEPRTRKWHYAPRKTRQWLIWLAQQMKQRQLTEFYLERLQPSWLPTKWVQIVYTVLSVLAGGLLGGLLGGLVFGPLVELLFGLLGRLLIGLLIGLLVGLLVGQAKEIEPSEKLTWLWDSFLRVGLLGGLLGGLVFGLVFGLLGRLLSGLVFGLVFGLLGGLLGGLSNKQIDQQTRLRPNQGIQTSGWNALRNGLVFGLLLGLVFGLVFGLLLGLVGGLVFGLLFGLVGGLVGGLLGGGRAYLQHYCLRFLLYRSGAMPWHYVCFLEEASERILLQRVGGGYRFIHPLFQDYFASLGTAAPPHSVEPPP